MVITETAHNLAECFPLSASAIQLLINESYGHIPLVRQLCEWRNYGVSIEKLLDIATNMKWDMVPHLVPAKYVGTDFNMKIVQRVRVLEDSVQATYNGVTWDSYPVSDFEIPNLPADRCYEAVYVGEHKKLKGRHAVIFIDHLGAHARWHEKFDFGITVFSPDEFEVKPPGHARYLPVSKNGQILYMGVPQNEAKEEFYKQLKAKMVQPNFQTTAMHNPCFRVIPPSVTFNFPDTEEITKLLTNKNKIIKEAKKELEMMSESLGNSYGVKEVEELDKILEDANKTVCPDCNGTRKYVGLFETGPCETCQVKPKCHYCVRDDTETCSARNKHSGSFVCTRPKGHTGSHVACGSIDHRIKEW